MNFIAKQLQSNFCSSSVPAPSHFASHRRNSSPSRSSLTNFPRGVHTLNRVCGIYGKIQPRNHFEVKSSNGCSLNEVSWQDEGRAAMLPEEIPLLELAKEDSMLSITIVGASGDLAKKKIFPALFALYYEDCLPKNFIVFGYARTKMNDEELRDMISATLNCRVDSGENCDAKMEQFLERCFYHSGQYSSEDHFAELDRKLKEKEVTLVLKSA